MTRENGLIRFNKDGFGTLIEDSQRLHYQPAELKKFDGIESEWPVFFAFLLIDAKFRNKVDEVQEYESKLKQNMFNEKIPTYIQVTLSKLFAQKIGKRPVFLPNFQWIQSVTIIALMLAENLVRLSDISPRGLFEKSKIGDEKERILERTIQVALISENATLQTVLSSYGVESETPAQTEPIVIWPTQDLVELYATMGVDRSLGLTGRPRRPIGVIRMEID